MSNRRARLFRQRAIEELHKAQGSFSADLRALHVRWANFYSDRLAQIDSNENSRRS